LRYKLLLATNNEAKVREYRSLLRNLPFELVTLAELGVTTAVDEVGESLEENARLKATTLAAEAHLLALADELQIETGSATYWRGLRGCPGRSALPVSGALLL